MQTFFAAATHSVEAVTIFEIILVILIVLHAYAWYELNGILRRTSRPRLWRSILAMLTLSSLLFVFCNLLAFELMGRLHAWLGYLLPASIFLWNLLVLPATVIVLLIRRVVMTIRGIGRWLGKRSATRVAAESATAPTELSDDKGTGNAHPGPLVFEPKAQIQRPEFRARGEKPNDLSIAPGTHGGLAASTVVPVPEFSPGVAFSRRQLLRLGAVSIPPLATALLTGASIAQLGKFRIRPMDLTLSGWPRDLEGFTIAVVADIHAGAFSTQKMLDDIANATNNLHADLILLAGDLVNVSHADLPNALDVMMRLDARHGIYMIQGNHDLIEGPEFDDICRARGMNLLVDEIQTLRPRGTPIQLLGARWTAIEWQMRGSVRGLGEARDHDLFPILLAHHPHSWDPAITKGLPLTLSGHTHGGQIMLTDHIGGGPLRFKYWSGLYQRTLDNGQVSNLVVSNGVGNWFPLRVNAPAEILKITLHAG